MKLEYPLSLKKFIDSISKEIIISNVEVHQEGKEYSASRFSLDGKTVEFRIAKITPKKTGAFVTIWKRNDAGITKPFDENDEVDGVVFICETDKRFGAFIFPKEILVNKKIFSKERLGGKRGIRVYPPWDLAANAQAKKTQNWQVKYFLDFDDPSPQQHINKFLET